MPDTVFPPTKLAGPVGQSIVRSSGHDKVTGKATFSAEWPIEGVLHAVAVAASEPAAKIKGIETKDAAAMPGVRLVLTPDNVPEFTRVKSMEGSGFQTNLGSTVFPCAEREVHHAGQYVAAVVADTFESARDAALAVKVTYEPTEFVTDIDQAPADERPPQLMGAPPVIEIGDAEKALAQAEVKVDLRYPLDGNHHNPIEPHATIAEWSESGGKPFVTVWDTSQSLSLEQATVAQMFGLDKEQVRIVCKYVGGAFGSKGALWPQAIVALLAAKAVGKPVKCVATRRQMYGGTGHRTPIRQRMAFGAGRDGKITSIIHEGVATTSTQTQYSEAFTMATRMMYDTPNLRLSQKQCRLNTQAPTFMRAPAETPGMFPLEAALDELAEKLGMDPIDLRELNEPTKDVHNGKPFSGRHLIECFRKGAEQFGWNERDPQPRSTRDGHWLIGTGCAANTYPVNFFPTTAKVILKADGTAKIECGSQEIGTGTRTVQSQLLADLLDIPAGRVSMELGDTVLPRGGLSGGSATTGSVGGAVRKAVDALKMSLVAMAGKDSPLNDADPEKLQFQDGKLVTGDGRGSAFEDILHAAMKPDVSAEGSFAPQTDTPTSNHSFGAHFCEVAVDEDFGVVRVRRFLGCFACGTILNRRTGRSQFLGGIVMGIGHALQEATHWDHRLGRITNDNLAEYHVPVNADVPHIDVMWLDEPDFNASPIGAKGIGEIGITGVAAAVANAIHHATGRRLRSLPITPEMVMR